MAAPEHTRHGRRTGPRPRRPPSRTGSSRVDGGRAAAGGRVNSSGDNSCDKSGDGGSTDGARDSDSRSGRVDGRVPGTGCRGLRPP
ncbi:hypothetical protein ATKI12_7469 [Kitasatospora sp. Ki12]